jgi:hypothetical protein
LSFFYFIEKGFKCRKRRGMFKLKSIHLPYSD